MNMPPSTPPPTLMKGEELLLSFSFVFSYISLLFKYPFKCPVMSQIFLTLQGIAADPLSAQNNIYWDNHEHMVSH